MRTDKYTKAVLTVIAIMLTVIAFKTVTNAFGASPKQADGSGAGGAPSSTAGVTRPAFGPSPKKTTDANGGTSARTSSSTAAAVPAMAPMHPAQIVQDDSIRKTIGKTAPRAGQRKAAAVEDDPSWTFDANGNSTGIPPDVMRAVNKVVGDEEARYEKQLEKEADEIRLRHKCQDEQSLNRSLVREGRPPRPLSEGCQEHPVQTLVGKQ